MTTPPLKILVWFKNSYHTQQFDAELTDWQASAPDAHSTKDNWCEPKKIIQETWHVLPLWTLLSYTGDEASLLHLTTQSAHNWLNDETNVTHSVSLGILYIILKMAGLQMAVLRANVLIHILYQWYASRNTACTSCNEAVWLQTHMNIDPVHQNANIQQIIGK